MYTFLIPLFAIVCTSWLSLTLSCPSTRWVQCAENDNQNCVIPGSINATTIAYGDDTDKIWTFLEIKNAAHPAADFSIACNDATFGEISTSSSKICCYNPYGNTINVDSEFDNEANWVLAGNSQDTEFDVPYTKGFARWVRYGFNGQYIYRLFSYQVECTSTIFGTLNDNSDNNMCWYLNSLYDSNANYISCGSSTDAICNLMVDTDDTQTIRLVKYGAQNASAYAYHDQFYYRFVYSDSGSVPCNDNLFGAVAADDPNQCYVEPVTFSNFFVNPTGYWVQAGYCSDCILSPSVEYGVTSTSTNAATTTWSDELSKTVGESFSFFSLSVSHSVTETVSESVSESMSEAFQASVSRTCQTTCGDKNGTFYLYQWVMKIGEIIETDVVPFLAYGCEWVCTESADLIPQCPLNACANSNCTLCKPWEANATSQL